MTATVHLQNFALGQGCIECINMLVPPSDTAYGLLRWPSLCSTSFDKPQLLVTARKLSCTTCVLRGMLAGAVLLACTIAACQCSLCSNNYTRHLWSIAEQYIQRQVYRHSISPAADPGTGAAQLVGVLS